MRQARLFAIKIFAVRLVCLVAAAAFLFVSSLNPVSVSAQEACSESRLRDLGITVVNCAGNTRCSTNGNAGIGTGNRILPGSSVYVLGDSLTVGMRDAGDLAGKLTAAGLVPTKINAEGGRALSWGQEQLTADAAIIANTQAVVIGLGTNNVATVVTDGSDGPSRAVDGGQQILERSIQGMIHTINPPESSTRKQLFWTTVYISGTLSTQYGDFNMDIARPIINAAIKTVAANNGVTIIPWDTFGFAPTWTAADGIHPSGHYPDMATFLVGNLTSPGTQPTPTSGTASGCSCSLTLGSGDRNTRYRSAWAYLTGTREFSEEAAAGIMGNLEAESGIDPHNVQNDAVYNGQPVPDGPEIPLEQIRGSYGYGIAQWTSAGRQQNLVAYAAETGRSTGDLGLQLDFLLKELAESYTGVATVLETPGVTIEEASFVFLSEFEIPRPFTSSGTQAERDAETENRRARSQAIFDEFSGQSVAGGAGAGCTDSGVAIDLESSDTTAIPCGPGTVDAGEADGYRDGRLIRIRLCTVGGTRVNSQISGGVARMLSDSAGDGINLSINGSFRDMEGQIAIYRGWCERGGIVPTPPPYPKANWSDYTRCPGGAPPGYSNHQAGLALDLNCNGTLMPMSYADGQNNECFQWLVANASQYGLYEYSRGQNRSGNGYESWHWSVDGG